MRNTPEPRLLQIQVTGDSDDMSDLLSTGEQSDVRPTTNSSVYRRLQR